MTIQEAIAWLQRLEEKHGSGIVVYFDCPNCKLSYAPTTIEASAVHIKSKHQ
jgi:hypothetical protein